MPELWIPGAAGPSLEDFVEKLHKSIATYQENHGLKESSVQVELADGALLWVRSISPEPGYGFITLCPHTEDRAGSDPNEDVIVPVGSIRRIILGPAEAQRARFGFSLPEKSGEA